MATAKKAAKKAVAKKATTTASVDNPLAKLSHEELAQYIATHTAAVKAGEKEQLSRKGQKDKEDRDELRAYVKAKGMSKETVAKAFGLTLAAAGALVAEGEGSAPATPRERKETAKPYGIAGMVYPETQPQKDKRGQPVAYSGRGTLPKPLREWMETKEAKTWRDDAKNTTMFPVLAGNTMKGEDSRWTPATRKTAWSKLLDTKTGRPAGT